jgi:REP element-mobilizing transposase RayT
VLHHVIVRGIERCDIFGDDEDRGRLVSRLGDVAVATGTEVLAWALIPNHFHLLLRPTKTKLSTVMRRVLTGYATTFNRRHQRAGHLFQNRYKSIVCEEEPYLLELVRYIHLNPLRAGLVQELGELDAYPWSGHAVVLGNGVQEGQVVEEVLARFGSRVGEARQRYREFIAAGVGQGRREELVGGGLRRSLAGSGEPPGEEDKQAYDERVLGGGTFVERLWGEEEQSGRPHRKVALAGLIENVARHFGVDPVRMLRRGKDPQLVQARGVACYLAARVLAVPSAEVGRMLGLGRSGVSRALSRGEESVRRDPSLAELASERSSQ